MANTNDLRIIVEPHLKAVFVEKYQCNSMDLSSKDLKYVFDGLEPDLVACDKNIGLLYIGEITTSGYLGAKGRSFHHGTVKKVFEAFGKFYLMQTDKENILRRFTEFSPGIKLLNISCHFIMPAGAQALTALGYRQKLFEQGVMKLEELMLSKEVNMLMCEILKKASQEMNF